MSLLFFDSFQDANLVPKPEYAQTNASASTGRDGSTNGAAQMGGNNSAVVALPSAASTCIAGVAWKLSAFANSQFLGFNSDVSTVQVCLTVNVSTGMIEVRRTSGSGTLLGTSTGHVPINQNVWFHIAAKVVLDSGTAGSAIVQLNGVTVLTLTGITTSSVTGPVTHFRFATGGSNQFFDDCYICDGVNATATQGRPNNDFLGDIKVGVLFPSGVGDTTQWTPSTGANWATADEVPPNTTDYVSSSTSGQRDLYQMSDPAGAINTVYGVRTGYYATKADAGGSYLKPAIKENGTVTVDPLQGVAFGSWVNLYGTARYVRPSDNAVWTQTDLNNLQVGMELA